MYNALQIRGIVCLLNVNDLAHGHVAPINKPAPTTDWLPQFRNSSHYVIIEDGDFKFGKS